MEVRRRCRVWQGEHTRPLARPGWRAMFTTLSGSIQRPEDCLEIECLFDHAMSDQTAKRFSEPLRIERIGPGRRPSIPEATTLRDVQTRNRVRIFRVGPKLAKKLQRSWARRISAANRTRPGASRTHPSKVP